MSLDNSDYEFIKSLSKKKEFAQYANLNKIHPEKTFAELINIDSNYLELQHVQALVKRS